MTVLVTAASKHGATDEIAWRIARQLTEAGVPAVVVPPGQVSSLEGYDAVVLGSAVYAGRWLGPAKQFVERFATGLRARPVWLFSSGPIGDPPKPVGDPADVDAVRAATMAREHRVIPGELDPAKLGFAERAITRVVGAQGGDYRPWPEIDAWVRTIADQLSEPVH